MEIEQFLVMQVVHNVDLVAYHILVLVLRCVDEFGNERLARGFLDATVYHAERATLEKRIKSILALVWK